jgi:hypothetical protein
MSKKLEQVKGHIKDVKNHVVENKTVYITAGVSTALAAAAFAAGRYSGVKQVVLTDVGNVKLWSPTTTSVTVVLEELSTRSKPIYCPELKRAFNSIHHAARELGVDRGSISKNLSGQYKSAGNLTFEYIDI